MFDLGSYNVVAQVPSGPGDALNGGVIGLGAATGEDDLVRLTEEQSGDLGACAVDGVSSFEAVAVGAGRITEAIVQVGLHRVDHVRVERCGRVVIEIDGAVGHKSSFCTGWG